MRLPEGKRLLMEAAARLAARQGSVHTLVLREIAREAGLNHNTLYRHFESVEDMVRVVVSEFTGELRAGLRDARRSVPAGDPVTPAVVGWLFDFARGHRDAFTVAMRELYGPAGPIRDVVRGLLDDLLDDMMQDLNERGTLPGVDADRMRRVFRTILHETFRRCMEYVEAPGRRAELLREAQETFDTLVVGAMVLRAPSPRASP